MSGAKFTTEPWSAEGVTVFALHGNPRRNRFTALVQSGRRDDASEEERLANACLMAAAPDLLEALQEVTDILDMVLGVGGGYPLNADGPAVKARAAIRKALGSATC